MDHFKLVSWIVLILFFSKGSEGFRISQSYSVVEALGNSCPASESCEHRRSAGSDPEATPNDYSCACDDECSEYDDCCLDGPRRPLERNQMKCLEVEDQGGVYMIDSCPREFNGSEIVRQLCDLIYLNYQLDPLMAMPLTEPLKRITYKNSYCQLCNKNKENYNETKDIFYGWLPKLDCSHQTHQINNSEKESERESIVPKLLLLTYIWPYDDRHFNGTRQLFNGCDVIVHFDTSLFSTIKVRRCRPNLVSDCPPTWKDEFVRSMCESYTGARFDHQAEGRGYKNVHCAICNGVDVTRLSCKPLKRTGTYQYPRNDSDAEIEAVKEKIKQCMEIDRKKKYCV